jgi:hypothetical protein
MTFKRVRKQIRKQAKQRRKLEDEEAHRVKPWSERVIDGKVPPEDYDFRGWAKDASKNCLRAGAVYEYARESPKLRCLLVLMNPQRKRERFETTTAPDGSGEQIRLPCSFKNLDEKDAEEALGGWLYCLADLSDYLAANISFGELFRTKREELERAFGGLNRLERVRRGNRYFYPVDAVTLAWGAPEVEQTTVCETVVDQLHEGEAGRRQRTIRSDGSEIVALRIRWGSHTDNEIGAAMKRFARRNRPTKETCKEPQRKGRGREDTLLSALDNLSAMRLIRWRPIGEAIRLFAGVRLNARGGALEQRKVRDQKAEAESDFRRDFPFQEDPANCGTFALSP